MLIIIAYFRVNVLYKAFIFNSYFDSEGVLVTVIVKKKVKKVTERKIEVGLVSANATAADPATESAKNDEAEVEKISAKSASQVTESELLSRCLLDEMSA